MINNEFLEIYVIVTTLIAGIIAATKGHFKLVVHIEVGLDKPAKMPVISFENNEEIKIPRTSVPGETQVAKPVSIGQGLTSPN